jgi:TPR repeat protein
LRGPAQYYKLDADQGDAAAQYNYGKCLDEGEGVSKDLRGAAQYYKLAADQGDAEAQYYFAICLLTGNVVN